MDNQFLEQLKNSTPVIQGLEDFIDADDEMLEIAEYIKKHNQHNEYIEPKRIKFLYSPKPKKDGSRYILFELTRRTNMEKMINNDFDFILTVFYDVWATLKPEQKIIQLDKALCGIEIDISEAEAKSKKKSPDSKEYVANMLLYGPQKVMEISSMVDMACVSAIETRKEEAKNKKKGIPAQLDDIDALIPGE